MKRVLVILCAIAMMVAFTGCATIQPISQSSSEKVISSPSSAVGKISVKSAPMTRAIGDVQQVLKFEWQQAITDLPNLEKWILYVRGSAGATTPLNKIDVPYTGGAGPDFTAQSGFNVTGNAGATVRRYFVLTAVSKNTTESGFSNEVFYDFQIPYSDVSAPITLKVPVMITPQ